MILDDILKILKSKSSDKAYTMNEQNYSYFEFYKYVCNIYEFLLNENINKKPVIVYGHKEVYMKATFLACSFAGMPYVPIDVSMPEARVKTIINQVNPDIIIKKENINEIMHKSNFKEINKIYLEPNDIYYIIFTSGTTGMPKGVEVTYKNLDSCINWLKSITKVEKGVILNQANFSFDLSIADLYLSLISESEHFILDNSFDADFVSIFDNLKKSEATLAVMTPSFVDLLLLDKSFNQELMPCLKTIIFCGEKLLKSTVQRLYSRFENIKIINCYGPTETTFAVTSMEIPRNLEKVQDIPCGLPKKDVEIFIVDNNMKVLPDGEIGEIMIIGESVANGYMGIQKENTFINYNGKKAYLTGDLGFIKKDILYYKCRKDKQIKYKGYRIEISDIEKNLDELDYIEKAVVVAKKDTNDKVTKLIAFVKLKNNIVNKTSLEIRSDLLLRIPSYMCPNIKIIKQFPINKNGKCDEEKLLEEY